MKILHVTQGYAPAIGGTEWLIQRVSEELVSQFGDDVTVFTTNCFNGEAFFSPHLPAMPVGWEELNGVKILRFAVRRRLGQIFRKIQTPFFHLGIPGNQYLRALGSGPIIPGLEAEIRKQPADVIAASSFPLLHMFAVQRAARATGRPDVLHGGLHPHDTWGFDRPMIYQAVRKARAYIANTQFEADYVISKGAACGCVHVIGVGVDLQNFTGISQDDARRRLGLGSQPLVGFIGQLGAAKGVDVLVEAMSKIWEVEPQTHLLLAGGRTLFVQQLEEMIHALPEAFRSQVHLFYNFADADKPFLFAAVDVFAYPSGYESFGIAFPEAWACRKPVIGCFAGAVPWVVTAGRDGLLVNYRDVPQLAEALLLLLRNPGYAQRLGEAGYQKVIARYTWPNIARRFRQVYQQVLRPAGVAGRH